MAEQLFDVPEQRDLERRCRQPPVIHVQDNFLTHAECDHLAGLAAPHFQPAMVCGDKSGFQSQGRTGNNCWLKHDTDEATSCIVKRVAALLGVPTTHAESLQMIYYNKTQEYRNHYDGWLHDGSEKMKRTMRRGGQRIWTALCYLNTVPRGGTTRFTKLHREVRAWASHTARRLEYCESFVRPHTGANAAVTLEVVLVCCLHQ
jgi:prolyl 4-hydroxylase